MTQMVTRCPKCATAFRITSTQLESAKGSVRCGSCLHIFKAQEHLVKPVSQAAPLENPTANTQPKPGASQTPKIPAPAPAPAPAVSFDKSTTSTKVIIDKAKVLEDEDDTLISDDMDKPTQQNSSYEFDGFLDIDMHPKQTVSLFEREIRYETEQEKPDTTDESWAEQLLDDDDDNPAANQHAKPITAPLTKYEEDTESTAEEDQHEHYNAPLFSLVSESNAEEQHIFNEEFLKATRAPDAEQTPRDDNNPAAYGAELFAEEEEEATKTNSAKKPVKSATKMRAFDTSRAALLMNIMPAPVEFTAKRVRRWYQKKLWPTLAILMGIALLLQIAYFKFDYFSRVEPYRTAYVFACPLIGCKVPSLIDTQKIAVTTLIVRKHPEAPNALMVDIILLNNAPFEQPFPVLTLVFSTMDDVPIASRNFAPQEYLAGELAGADHIPMNQKIHISLELADPGPEAVNYHMSIQ